MSDPETTCEACLKLPLEGGRYIAVYRHIDDLYVALAAKDAEIARLRDVIRHGLDAHIEGSVIRMRIFAREAKAALARKEEP